MQPAQQRAQTARVGHRGHLGVRLGLARHSDGNALLRRVEAYARDRVGDVRVLLAQRGDVPRAQLLVRAGASLVQLYSAMVYEGPGIARRIVRGLEKLMRRDGFASIAEAVGSE